MVHALEAGTIVAVMAGVIGWFMVLRRQTFAGHTLSVIAFPGRFGRGPRGRPAGGRLLRRLRARRGGARRRRRHRGAASQPSRRRSARSARSALALGFLFVSLYHGNPQRARLAALRDVPRDHVGTGDHARGRRRRVGRRRRPRPRPLLFASVDPRWPEARGVPVRAARARVPARARACGRGDESDHRRAARLRAARHARRDRAADHRPPVAGSRSRLPSRSSSPGSGWRSRTSRTTRSASTSRAVLRLYVASLQRGARAACACRWRPA